MPTKELVASLPKALRPPSNEDNMGFRQGIVSALEALESLTELPSGFQKAQPGVYYSPPKFDFGWLILTEDLISTLRASRPDCLVYTPMKDMKTDKMREVLDWDETLARVQEELQIPKQWTLRLEDILQIEDDDMACLSLTNSYDNGNETPPEDVIERVQIVFGLEGQPRWFLDFHDAMWRRRLFFELEGKLIATTDI